MCPSNHKPSAMALSTEKLQFLVNYSAELGSRDSSKPKMRPSIRRSACSWSQTWSIVHTSVEKCWDRKDVEKYGNIMNLKVAIGPSLNTRPVLQISEDLVDGKSPTACMDKFARQMLSNRSENSLKLIWSNDWKPEPVQNLFTKPFSWLHEICQGSWFSEASCCW